MKHMKLCGLLACALAVLPAGAFAAYLHIVPETGNFHVGENFNAGIYVSTEEPVNAMQGVIAFPTEFLQAVNADGGGNSIVNLWVQKPSLSNAGDAGNVRFEGVVLNPGFTGANGKIIEVTFRVRKEGFAEVSFTDFAVLANDGLGTDISTAPGKAEFTLLGARAAETGSEATLESNEVKIKAVEEKIKSVEEQIKNINVLEPAEGVGVTGFWNTLPGWLKVIALIVAGAIMLVVGLLAVSFGALILIWLWNFILRRKTKFTKWAELLPARIRRFRRKASGAADAAKKELTSDVRFAFRELKEDYREAEKKKSFLKIVKNFWVSVIKIAKRFFEDNVKK
ncbi:hypothetical protein A2110_02320 [Candidatus Jorgensenbacteria bacterium GWA1_54_12]|uniref:Cohesin domain-containing protein n=1 Tax=Candidatus Jorgensenbacteria bacterium GWA1_54_12 TaxID=1798468 RepID=A0A1F6BKT7_9BACT|nr:MAG: hypothetical protein A2110_02320 [Candidatus Jorgensenbacteria bacterium GWA1_54_12]